jgi:hypothetical protein
VRRLLGTANVVPSSSILVTLMMEALNSSETPVISRATRRYIPEDAIPLKFSRFCSDLFPSIILEVLNWELLFLDLNAELCVTEFQNSYL